MSTRKLQRELYLAQRTLGDVRAAQNGRLGKRVARRYLVRSIFRMLGLVAVLGLSLTACGHKDNTMCDFYHSLSSAYVQSHGYTPSDIQDGIDEYC